MDRLLVLSGVIVCWHFELLPRWALALLAARELFVMALVRYGMRRGIDLKVNWLGRAGVWPIMSALFFAMCGVDWLADGCLYIGLALVLGSAAQYVRDGCAVRDASLDVNLRIAMLATPRPQERIATS